ncbi:MAG: response regulator [Maricaulaceae bacterium]
MAAQPRVLIVDDHPLFRDALETALVLCQSGEARTHQVASLAAAETALGEEPADLVLLDLNLSDARGFDGLSRLVALSPGLAVVVVSATECEQAYAQARALGARGYLPKSVGLSDMKDALSAVLNGQSWFPTVEAAPDDAHTTMARRVADLTQAQRRVLAFLADGLLNKQIAFEMGISEATVKAHMTAIFRKLGANNRTQALLAYKTATTLDEPSPA